MLILNFDCYIAVSRAIVCEFITTPLISSFDSCTNIFKIFFNILFFFFFFFLLQFMMTDVQVSQFDDMF